MRRISMVIVGVVALTALLAADPARTTVVAKGSLEVMLQPDGEPETADGGVPIPLELGIRPAKRSDSAICVRGAHARLKDGRIVVVLERGLCGPGSMTNYAVHLKRVPKGKYSVVYGDAEAGYPAIGEVVVE